jgi:hypothetical protein
MLQDRITTFFTALQNVYFWHKADMPFVLSYVRFWGKVDMTRTCLDVAYDPKRKCAGSPIIASSLC